MPASAGPSLGACMAYKLAGQHHTQPASEAPSMQPYGTETQTAHATRIERTREKRQTNHRYLADLYATHQPHARTRADPTCAYARRCVQPHARARAHTHTAALRLAPLFASVPSGLSSSLSSTFGFFWREVGRARAKVCVRARARPCVRARRESQQCGRQQLANASAQLVCMRPRTFLRVRGNGAVRGGCCCGGSSARAQCDTKSAGIQWIPAPRLPRYHRCGGPAATQRGPDLASPRT